MTHKFPFVVLGLIWVACCAGFSLHAASGPVAWWRAEGSTDDSAGSNNGVLLNGTAFAPGVQGLGFSFDGIDDEVLIPDGSDFTLTNGLTMEGWMRTSGTGDFAGLVDKFVQSTETSGFAVSMSGNNGFPPNRSGILRGDLGTGVSYATAFNLQRVDDGVPHHFALTCDGQQAILYVDGVAGDPAVATNWVPNNAQDILLGVDNVAASRHFNGALDEVAIYQRVLTAAEVQARFDAARPSLKIMTTSPGFVTLSWTEAASDFRLQFRDTLSPTNWADAPSGTNNPITVPTTPMERFYRLTKP
jgi:Concanavalin A-like lectin/glucanases superfamily